jgi:phenylalanyl-tRNA synthetase beta chain
MKISREWLQTFFDAPLPEPNKLAEGLTFHAFEIESVENDILDVKVTPNRGHDCLSHRGIGKEIGAIFDIPMTHDPFGTTPGAQFTMDASIQVSVEDPVLCPRYIAWVIKGIKVGPSPDWLKRRLEAIGERSINNIVDATNYVMFTTGQPLHAFDANHLKAPDSKPGHYAVGVRKAKSGERISSLDGKEYTLSEKDLLIVDGKDTPVGIAGVKGGALSGISEKTTDLLIESANFNGVSVRKTSQSLKLRTSASQRYEQVLSPELAAYGMRSVAALILEIAGGTLAGFSDVYPTPQQKKTVSVSLSHMRAVLGVDIEDVAVKKSFDRLGLTFTEKDGEYSVEAPPERLDIAIPDDLIEEVGRIEGYEKIPPINLSPMGKAAVVHQTFYAAEKVREEFMAAGYSEVFT